MNTFEKLERLTELAKKDETLRKALLKTRENKEPILSFCALAREAAATLRRMTLLTMPMRFSWRLLRYEEKV